MKKTKLIGGICLALILAVSLSGVALAAEEENESGPLPPSIMPVVILQGSDYEMGYQCGQQAGQYIEVEKDRAWASALSRFSYEEVLRELKAYQWYIKEYTPEAIEMMKGMAAGASDADYPLSYIDALLMNARPGKPGPTWTYPPGAEGDTLPPSEGCSSFAAWGSATKDGRLICGKSSDATFVHAVAIVAFPDDGNSYICQETSGSLASALPGMNDKGVFIGGGGGFARRAIDKDYGIPLSLSLVHIMRFANSASEAKDMLVSWKIAGSTNRLFADVNGDAFVVEKSAALNSVREPGQYTTGEEEYGEDTNFIYSTNNHFTDEGGQATLGEVFIPYAGWLGRSASISSISRNKEMWTMFDRYHGEVDLDFAKMMWRFPGNPPPEGSLYPTDPAVKAAYYDTQGEGWDQKICNLDNRIIGIAQPDDGDNGKMYICAGSPGRVAYILAPGAAYYQPEGTHTFYELTLASSSSKVVSAAKTAAHAYIAEAYHELMWLNYTDTGYTGLNELYSTANAEYYEGVNWTNKAKLASGNEALLYYGKAATAFTRAQAHAKQVYHALAPAADDPTDLGLKPYKETAWPGDKGKAKGKDKE